MAIQRLIHCLRYSQEVAPAEEEADEAEWAEGQVPVKPEPMDEGDEHADGVAEAASSEMEGDEPMETNEATVQSRQIQGTTKILCR